MTAIGVLCETAAGENRVALGPEAARHLAATGGRVLVETGAGERAFFPDNTYSGVAVVTRERVYAESDVLLCVSLPPDAAARCRPGQTLIGLLGLLGNPGAAQQLASAGITAISLELLPRTLSRAQSMDALTSQANVAGYKAALVAAEAYPGFFPMLMTAAGTTRPAQVLVLGAGVAGLQAIATARRLGARVTAFDVREAARADIVSTGAAVLDLGPVHAEGEGGYARGLTRDEAAAQSRALAEAAGHFDVIITTAQVPGGRPPVLVTAQALRGMRPGSVVIDLAAGPAGGNVEGAVPNTRTRTGGVTVIGAPDLAASAPVAASTAYARNLLALLASLTPGGDLVVDLTDEIHRGVVVSQGGRVIHPRVLAAIADHEGARA